MKSKILKFLVAGFLVLVGAIVAAVYFFPTDKIKKEIETAASEAMQQTVTIDKLKLSVLPTAGAKLSGLKIGTSEDLKLGKPQVSSDGVTVGVKLLPLLKKEVQVTKIAINQPRITLQATKGQT